MSASEATASSRDRLLASGKTLFGRQGYEQTSTSTIAREAGTSESQLVRYFGGKSGLLEAIFNEAWTALNDDIIRHTTEAEHGRDAIIRILTLMMQTFGRDHDIAFLFLFEGRRVRGNTLTLSKGFLRFHELLLQMVERGQRDGSFRTDVSMNVIASALVGAAEGMVRDRMIAERNSQAAGYEEAAIRSTYVLMVNALGQPESR